MVSGTLPTRYQIPFCYLTDEEWDTIVFQYTHWQRVNAVWEQPEPNMNIILTETGYLKERAEAYQKVLEKLERIEQEHKKWNESARS